MVVMAVSNSVVPLLWMTVRQEAISQDDLLYALVMWKLLGIYVDRPRGRQHRPAGAAVPVAVRGRRSSWRWSAIMQSLSLFGVPSCSPSSSVGPTGFGPAGGRGGSTAGPARRHRGSHGLQPGDRGWPVDALPRGTGWCWRSPPCSCCSARCRRGEFSSAIGLVVGVVCIAIVSGSPRMLAWFVPAAAVGGYVLWPVISTAARRLPVGVRPAGRAGPGGCTTWRPISGPSCSLTGISCWACAPRLA